MFDIIKCAVKNLYVKKIRSTLTIMGIAIGVCSVIIIGNISQCGTDAVNKELDSLGLNGLTISTVNFSEDSLALNDNDLKLVSSNPYVEQATPILIENTEIKNKNNSAINSLIWGIDSKANQIVSLNVIHGRAINSADVNAYNKVCLVDENFAKFMYERSNIVGKKIPILFGGITEDYEVIGIIKTGSGLLQSFIGDYIPNFIYIPYTTMQSITGRKCFDQIAVKINKNNAVSDINIIGDEIVNSLFKNSGNDNYQANNIAKQKDGLCNLLNIVTIVLSSVGAISLLVASLSIMTVMLVSVNERTREIGIKKSIGAKNRTILLEFLFEAIFLSVAGCILGSVVGSVISYVGAFCFGIALSIRFDIILISVLFSVFTAVIFGVYPASKAAKLKPVDALRTE